jgi:phosphoribosylglycinamide formyltransferase-1
MTKRKLIILASGEGTTTEAFIRAAHNGVVSASVTAVISNNSNAGVFRRVVDLNSTLGLSIPMHHISHKKLTGELGPKGVMSPKEAAAIEQLYQDLDASLVLLLGYMKRYTAHIPAINTHPGLLPLTAGLTGKTAQQRAIDSGQTYTGHTLHWVDSTYDTGDIISVHRIKINATDTAETLLSRVQASERKYIPLDLEKLFKTDA